MDVPLLGQSPKQEQKAPEIVEADTAFLAYLVDGQWTITPDINVPVKPARPASADEMVSCAAIVTMDMTAQKAAQATVQYQMIQAQAISKRQSDLRLLQEISQST